MQKRRFSYDPKQRSLQQVREIVRKLAEKKKLEEKRG